MEKGSNILVYVFYVEPLGQTSQDKVFFYFPPLILALTLHIWKPNAHETA
jgi:hypothetical protein